MRGQKEGGVEKVGVDLLLRFERTTFLAGGGGGVPRNVEGEWTWEPYIQRLVREG